MFSQLKNNWYEEQNEKLVEEGRRYLHFDRPFFNINKNIFDKVTDGNYIESHSFYPLLKRLERKRSYSRKIKDHIKEKDRPICYASHIDSLIYSWYAFILDHLYEEYIVGLGIGESVIGYRSLDSKSNIEFAKDVFEYIKEQDECVAVALDVKGFYNNLDHDLIKKRWTMLLNTKILPVDHYKVYKSITNFSYVFLNDFKSELGWRKRMKRKIFLRILKKGFSQHDVLNKLRLKKKVEKNKKERKKAGEENENKAIPQGLPISCVISNLYMIDFDSNVLAEINRIGGMYRRYSDDIIVIFPKKHLREIFDFMKKEIKDLDLELSTHKTEVRFFEKGVDGLLSCYDDHGKKNSLQYLGINFDGQNYKLRHSSYLRFDRKIRDVVKREVEKSKWRGKDVSLRKLYKKTGAFRRDRFPSYMERASSILGDVNLISKGVKTDSIVKKIKREIDKNMNKK